MKDLEIKVLNIDSGNETRTNFMASHTQSIDGELQIVGPDTGIHVTPCVRYKRHFIRIFRENPARGSVAVIQGKRQLVLCPGDEVYLMPSEAIIIDRLLDKCRMVFLTPK